MRILRLLAPLASFALIAAPATTDLTLTTPDGFILKGTLTLPAAKGKVPVVILAHQFRADRTGWAPLTERLAARGIGTLALDLRGHGASTQKGDAQVKVTEDFMASAKAVDFDHIPADLAQAAAWLRSQPGVDGRRIGLAGSSVGAFSAILAAPEVQPVAVLCLSPAGTGAFGAEARAHLKAALLRARASVLILASSGDQDAAENAQSLKDLPGVAIDLKEGDAHGFAYLKDHADLMAVFFGEYLTYHHHGEKAATPHEKAPDGIIDDKAIAAKKVAENPR
jgi:dienelactone hydrolase